jgi:hypothetical protein
MVPNFVLGSKKSSTYPEGTPPVFSRLRPCWTTILSILHSNSHRLVASKCFLV